MFTETTIIGFATNVKIDNSKGTKLLKFSIPDNEEWTDKNNNKQTKTTWYNIHTFNQKLIEYLEKKQLNGAFVLVKAKPEMQEYIAKDGTKCRDWSFGVGFNGTVQVLRYPTSSEEKKGDNGGDGAGVGSSPLNDVIPL